MSWCHRFACVLDYRGHSLESEGECISGDSESLGNHPTRRDAVLCGHIWLSINGRDVLVFCPGRWHTSCLRVVDLVMLILRRVFSGANSGHARGVSFPFP